ncbi:MAG: transposase [Planctomycetaceae bacterium]|nr:transposase [Planctomycetaceae bacterium]
MRPRPFRNVRLDDESHQTRQSSLDRTQKSLPLFPGRLKTLTHAYKRNGTTTLFAAIELAEGKIFADCMPRHRHQEWIKFLKKIDAEMPSDLDLHLIVDN